MEEGILGRGKGTCKVMEVKINWYFHRKYLIIVRI